MKCVFIDDQEEILLVLKEWADGQNLDAVFFTDPVVAVNALEKLDKAVVFTDMNMPHYSGVDIAELCKGFGFPVVLVAETMPSSEQVKLFKQVILKPINLDLLKKEVDYFKEGYIWLN